MPEKSAPEPLVVRIVYDGPSGSGKSASLRALAAALGPTGPARLFTPASTAEGTVYFDWLDFSAEPHQGRPVRCQLIAVSGATAMAFRRRKLLELADAVVLVADTRQSALGQQRQWLLSLQLGLAARREPLPIPIVLQANWRDDPEAVPITQLEKLVTGPVGRLATAVIESVAPLGAGVQEAFHFALRAALERFAAGSAPRARLSGGLALLQWLRQREAEASRYGYFPPPNTAEPRDDTNERVPHLPTGKLASAAIWPAVSGRRWLRSLAELDPQLERMPGGGWLAVAGGRWLLRSQPADRFADADLGRQVLAQRARQEARLGSFLSSRRVTCLAPTSHGHWRLWQALSVEVSLRDQLLAVLAEERPEAIAGGLQGIGETLLAAAETCRAHQLNLPLTLDSLGGSAAAPRFIEFVPAADPRSFARLPPNEWVGSLLAAPIVDRLAAMKLDAQHLALALGEPADTAGPQWREALALRILRLAA